MTSLASATGPLYFDQALETPDGSRWRVVAFPDAWGHAAMAFSNGPVISASAGQVAETSDYLLYNGPSKGEALKAALRIVAAQKALGFRRVATRN
jgi:hypothetical protein